MAQRAEAAVVMISTDFSEGSGFVINRQGHVITNAHVIAGASSVTVALQDGRQLQGQVIGRDDYLDLAYLELSGARGNFAYLNISGSATPRIGADVFAIGFPLGSGLGDDPTLTRGIVSAIRTDNTGARWIQTDASVNPGNSGGPLLDRSGRVVGVVTSKIHQDVSGQNVENVAFALSSTDLKTRINFLADGGLALIPVEPTPAANVGTQTDNWSFAGPGCPNAYPNCIEDYNSDYDAMLLGAFAMETDVQYDYYPDLTFDCIDVNWVQSAIITYGPDLPDGQAKMIAWLTDTVYPLDLIPSETDTNILGFAHTDTIELGRMIAEAEEYTQTLYVEVQINGRPLFSARFDPIGFMQNLNRLSCYQ